MLTLALLVELGGGRPLLSPEFDTYILSNQYQISNELARANPPPHGQYHGKSNAQYVQFSRPRARREGNEGRFDLTEQAGRASWLASFPQAGRVGERPLARGGPYTVREVRAVRASKAGGTRIPQLSFVSILERRASPQMPPTKPPLPRPSERNPAADLPGPLHGWLPDGRAANDFGLSGRRPFLGALRMEEPKSLWALTCDV